MNAMNAMNVMNAMNAINTVKAANAAPEDAETNPRRGVWSAEEHDKFLTGIKMYPNGPWKTIAEQIGTRSARQVQTHAQKYYEKVARRLRGLRKHRKKLVRPEHRLGDDMMRMCAVAAPDDTLAIDPPGADTAAGTDGSGVERATLPPGVRADFGIGSIGRGSLDVKLPSLESVCCLHSLGCGQLRSSARQGGNIVAPLTRPRSPPRPPRIHSLQMILEPNVK